MERLKGNNRFYVSILEMLFLCHYAVYSLGGKLLLGIVDGKFLAVGKGYNSQFVDVVADTVKGSYGLCHKTAVSHAEYCVEVFIVCAAFGGIDFQPFCVDGFMSCVNTTSSPLSSHLIDLIFSLNANTLLRSGFDFASSTLIFADTSRS